VVFIRRARSQYQSNQDKARSKNVSGRLEAIRADSRGLREPSDGNFQNRQQSADYHPENRDLPGSFHLTASRDRMTRGLSALLISDRTQNRIVGDGRQ
jgi:hypothetical protein